MKFPSAIERQRCVREKECTRRELVPLENMRIFPVIGAGLGCGNGYCFFEITHLGRIRRSLFAGAPTMGDSLCIKQC